MTLPQTHFDLVRPGLAVYGLSPVPDQASSAELGLRPAMSVRAQLSLVKRVDAGQGVSYGHAYVTDRMTSLGLVPSGTPTVFRGMPRPARAGEVHQC